MTTKQTKPKADLKKYYLVFGLLVVLVVSMAAAIIITNVPKRADGLTRDELQEISDRLDEDFRSSNELPTSLSELSIVSKRAVDYSKLDRNVAMLCAGFSGTNKGYDSNLSNAQEARAKEILEKQQSQKPQVKFHVGDEYLYNAPYDKGENCYIMIFEGRLR